ncbi:MAG: TonB-dependent receptor [Bacteroidaceae bacterium]|nr:TonB-dependent receptor [Bacteroidaceae bacterium]
MFTYSTRTRTVLTFHRFRRKGWALFAALGREVRIGVLTAGTLISATPRLQAASAHLFTTTDDDAPVLTDTVPLSEALVSGTRVPLAAQQAARQVTTLTRDDIAAAGVTVVSDVFKLVAPIDVRQRGAFGIQQDISIDGGTFDQTALLINGISYLNAQTGHNVAQFPFTLDDIERIEVLDGAASRLFGSGAFSGAINIITRSHDNGGQASVQAGSYGTVMAQARHAQTFGSHWHSSLSAAVRRSDGVVRNGDFKGGNVFWQGNYEDAALRVQAQAGHVADDFGANTFYSPANNQQWEATRRTLVTLSAQTKGRVTLAPSFAWTRSTDHYQWIRGTHTAENFNCTDVYTLGLNGFGSWSLGRTALGVEMRSENLLSGNLGNPMPETQWVRIPGQDGIYYTKSAQRTNLDIYAEHNILLSHVTLSLGLLAERNSALDHRFRLFPGIDASWHPTQRWTIFASWNQSLRLPSFTELWYRSPTQEGNVGLRPERNTQWRIGANWAGDGITLSAKAHYSRGRDMIDWVMYSPDDVYHAAAYKLRAMGFAVSGEADLRRLIGPSSPLLRLTATYAWLNQQRKDDADVFRSNYTMNYLRHKLVVTLAHALPFGIEAHWTMRLNNRAGNYLVYDGTIPTDRLKKYGTYVLLDAKLQRAIGRVSLTATLENITARRYVDVAGVPQPGCLVLFGAAVRW